MASIVARSSRWSFTLAAASTTPKGPPSPSTSTLSLEPFLPRSVGFLPTFFPPEPGLAQPAIRTLPLPVYGPQFIARGHQLGPEALHDAALAPALEPIVDGTLGAEAPWQLVPLAPRAHAKDDAVERLPPVRMVAAGGLGRPELLQDGENPWPQVVGNLPDRGQGLGLLRLRSFGLGLAQGDRHGCALLGDSLRLFYLLALQGRSPCFRIVS